MIFERLTLHNFQRYGGTSTIEFPNPDEAALVVVLAPNNTGKTTILRAIDFLFYGSLSGESGETAWKLITDRVREQTEVDIKVQQCFEPYPRFGNNLGRHRPHAGRWRSPAGTMLLPQGTLGSIDPATRLALSELYHKGMDSFIFLLDDPSPTWLPHAVSMPFRPSKLS